MSDSEHSQVTVEDCQKIIAQVVEGLSQSRLTKFLDAGEIELLYGVAYGFFTQNRFDQALFYFSLLMKFRPLDERFLSGAAHCYRQLGRFECALLLYSLIISQVNPVPVYALHMALCYLGQGDTDAAQRTLSRVVLNCQEKPEEVDILLRAQALQQLIDSGAELTQIVQDIEPESGPEIE